MGQFPNRVICQYHISVMSAPQRNQAISPLTPL
jgi:hypothetical protein